MIIWLASYPRSGNTLLRTILKQTMGLGSFSDEPAPSNIGFTKSATNEFGHLPLPESWESFYDMARESEKTYLIKTHLPPRDDQPAIYVVRDGRLALVSYQQYHRKYFPEHPGGLLELVLGLDYYGGWSQHYTSWVDGKRKVLLTRYEDLVGASMSMLGELAGFIRHNGIVSEWLNTFEYLHGENPEFFRIGNRVWQGSAEWNESVNGIFFQIHGELMAKLGYTDQAMIDEARATLPAEMIKMISVVLAVNDQKQALEEVCRERLLVINKLDAKIKQLSSLARFPILKRLKSWVR